MPLKLFHVPFFKFQKSGPIKFRNVQNIFYLLKEDYIYIHHVAQVSPEVVRLLTRMDESEELPRASPLRVWHSFASHRKCHTHLTVVNTK